MSKAIPAEDAKKIRELLEFHNFLFEMGYDKEGVLLISCFDRMGEGESMEDDKKDISETINSMELPYKDFFRFVSFYTDEMVESVSGEDELGSNMNVSIDATPKETVRVLQKYYPGANVVDEEFNHTYSVYFKDGKYGYCGYANGYLECELYPNPEALGKEPLNIDTITYQCQVSGKKA